MQPPYPAVGPIEEVQMEVVPCQPELGRDQAMAICAARYGSSKDIQGKFSNSQMIQSFWKEQYGEETQEPDEQVAVGGEHADEEPVATYP